MKLLILLLTIVTYKCNAHGILVNPAPRPGSNGATNIGIKIPIPIDQTFFNTCGNAAIQPGPATTRVQSGSSMPVVWNVAIDHASDPGVFIGLRCVGESNFTQLVGNIKVQDKRTSVNIPQSAKGDCELQWRWSSLEDGGSYISCSDIAVLASSGVPGLDTLHTRLSPNQPTNVPLNTIPDIPTSFPVIGPTPTVPSTVSSSPSEFTNQPAADNSNSGTPPPADTIIPLPSTNNNTPPSTPSESNPQNSSSSSSALRVTQSFLMAFIPLIICMLLH